MGSGLPKPVTSLVTKHVGGKAFEVGFAEMNGYRASMEDAHVIHMQNDWGFFGVFDGHGGDKCSAFIAKRYIEELTANGPPVDDEAMKELALRLDQEFLAREEASGSTGTFVIVTPMTGGKYKLRTGNVGDSRILLGRESGEIYPGPGTDYGLTTDHKPCLDSERARIEAAGGKVEIVSGVARVNGDLAVSRAFGDAQHKTCKDLPAEKQQVSALPELKDFECDSSDFLMLVCDGISEGSFPNTEVIKLAADKLKRRPDGSPVDPRDGAIAVCREAIVQGSKDNLSCMIVKLGGCEKSFEDQGFLPGPASCMDHVNFMTAYKAMASHAGLSPEQAVELRYKNICSDLQDLERTGSALGALTSDGKEVLQQEKETYGEGPSSGSPDGSEDSLAWFRDFLAEQASAPRSSQDGLGFPMSPELLQMMNVLDPAERKNALGVKRQAKVKSDAEQLKLAMEAHPALKWDERMLDVCGVVGGVLVDDDSDGTSQVKFDGALGFKAWLPTNMLEDVEKE